MKLIADSGSTKTDWCCLENGQQTFFKTQGINPFWMTENQIQQIIQLELLPQISHSQTISEIYFYGAGCIGDKINVIKNILQTFFHANKIEVHSDLLAAARATAAKEKGLILILGTGSNCGLYDGEKFIQQIPSLGFLLGDEGSGSWIGKKLLADFFRGNLPREINDALQQMIPQKTFAEFNTHLKEQVLQGRFLAQFAKVLKGFKSHVYTQRLIQQGFQALFENVIQYYVDYKNQPLFAAGSVAFYFEEALNKVANQFEISIKKVEQTPMEGLVRFHQ